MFNAIRLKRVKLYAVQSPRFLRTLDLLTLIGLAISIVSTLKYSCILYLKIVTL
jgi:hypothetical protein